MLPDRFLSKFRLDSDTECWVWQAAHHGDGYGVFWVRDLKRTMGAHRYAYLQLIGPIPDGLVLDHFLYPGRCVGPTCVNPAHLQPKTINQNGQRERGNYCRKLLHELVGENVGWRSGRRYCRPCRNENRNTKRRNLGRDVYAG